MPILYMIGNKYYFHLKKKNEKKKKDTFIGVIKTRCNNIRIIQDIDLPRHRFSILLVLINSFGPTTI